MLVFVATPIGNLADFSKRAISALQEADEIYCEDTRHSKTLLDHYEIKKPLYSYHKFNEKKSLDFLLEKLAEGKNIAVISDAGTPCLSDPGAILANACRENGIPFTAIPGPCSPILALVLCGFIAERFQFVGFLQKKETKILRSYFFYPGITIAFESPHRIISTLEAMQLIDPLRPIAILREMTKKHEECLRGTPETLLAHFQKNSPRGEFVICISQGKMVQDTMTPKECIELLQTMHGYSLKEAIKEAANLLDQNKRKIYKDMHG